VVHPVATAPPAAVLVYDLGQVQIEAEVVAQRRCSVGRAGRVVASIALAGGPATLAPLLVDGGEW
jgi:hypothetical protein